MSEPTKPRRVRFTVVECIVIVANASTLATILMRAVSAARDSKFLPRESWQDYVDAIHQMLGNWMLLVVPLVTTSLFTVLIWRIRAALPPRWQARLPWVRLRADRVGARRRCG